MVKVPGVGRSRSTNVPTLPWVNETVEEVIGPPAVATVALTVTLPSRLDVDETLPAILPFPGCRKRVTPVSFSPLASVTLWFVAA
jgi:hypothetical protein